MRSKLDERAALLAQHWEAAGDSARRRLAGARARRPGRDSTTSPRRCATGARLSELVEALPDSAETELRWRSTLGVARLDYGWRLGISEQEATAHYEAGRELASEAATA